MILVVHDPIGIVDHDVIVATAPSLIFLDADHTYGATRADLQWAISFPDTVVCRHDYRPAWPGVIAAVDEIGGPASIVGTLCTLQPKAERFRVQ